MENIDKEIKFVKLEIETLNGKELQQLLKRKLELLEELKDINNKLIEIEEENGKELDEFYSNLEKEGNK